LQIANPATSRNYNRIGHLDVVAPPEDPSKRTVIFCAHLVKKVDADDLGPRAAEDLDCVGHIAPGDRAAAPYELSNAGLINTNEKDVPRCRKVTAPVKLGVVYR
jgi:hypothetical protein